MKTSISLTKLTLITLGVFVACYAFGTLVIEGFYSLWSAETVSTGTLLLASTLPIAGVGKVKMKEVPISVINHTTAKGRNRKGIIYGALNSDGTEPKLPFDLWYLFVHSDNRAISLFDSQGYNQEAKRVVFLLKPEYATQDEAKIVADVRSFVANGLTPEIKEAAKALQDRKTAEKEAKKATKGTKATVNGVSSTAAKIQALKDLHKEGLITPEKLAESIAAIV